jgi:prophage antirepressor-like protein
MNNLQVLDERKVLHKDFTIYGTPEEPLFLAKDVAEWIDHSNPTEMLRSVDEDEKLVSTILSSGQNREVLMLTENGFYEVLMLSRKPIAKKFKKEVKKILKSIRKHGAYMTPKTIEEALLNPDTIIKLATKLKEEQAINRKQQQIIGELKPKADYTDTILKNKGLVTITQIAKDYGMSGQAMNKILYDLEIQYKQSGQWLLYREHQGKGYTHSETVEITRSNGMPDIKMNTKWTQKGRLFLYEVLKKNDILPDIEKIAS